MDPKPEAVGLWICERVIVERGTGSLSIIAAHTKRQVHDFPAESGPFSVFSIVTGGRGSGTIQWRLVSCDEMEEVDSRAAPIEFSDPAASIRAHFRIGNIRFPRAGTYSVGLFIDDELIAEQHLRVFA
jgi:hypothetical protein